MNHKYSFHCAWSKEDKAFIAAVPELPGCMADGHTVEEALHALDVVISEWIETAKEQKRRVPKPLSSEDYHENAKRFEEELAQHVKREVESAVKRVIQDISHYNPVMKGVRDAA